MDAPTALDRLRRMVAADSQPVLDAGDLLELIELAKQYDRLDRPPTDPAWEPTWNLRGAASEGWRWKAGKVASGYDFQTDGQQFTRSQMHDHCMAMSSAYGRGGFVSVQMGTPSLNWQFRTRTIANLDVDLDLDVDVP